MLIYLYGPDSYRCREKLNEYLKRYKEKFPAFSLSYFYLSEDGELEKLKDFSKAISLFDKSRLGVVFGASALEEKQKKEYAKILKDNLETKDLTFIIYEDKRPSKELSFLLEKPVLSQQFENLTGAKLRIFLQKETAKRSLIIDQESRNLLAQIYNGDTWGLITELDKLAFLDHKEITRNMLEKYIDISLPINIFAMLSQMKSSRLIKDRLALLEELFMKSADPAMIFNTISVFAKDAGDKKKMADYDAAIKSGKLEYEEALTDLVIGD